MFSGFACAFLCYDEDESEKVTHLSCLKKCSTYRYQEEQLKCSLKSDCFRPFLKGSSFQRGKLYTTPMPMSLPQRFDLIVWGVAQTSGVIKSSQVTLMITQDCTSGLWASLFLKCLD